MMSKLARYTALVLMIGGGIAMAVGATYAAWLFWTDPSWAYAKVIGSMIVAGPLIAVVANALSEYADRSANNNQKEA